MIEDHHLSCHSAGLGLAFGARILQGAWMYSVVGTYGKRSVPGRAMQTRIIPFEFEAPPGVWSCHQARTWGRR